MSAPATPGFAAYITSLPRVLAGAAAWRLVPREELTDHLPGSLGHRVLAAPDALADGSTTAELENGRPAR